MDYSSMLCRRMLKIRRAEPIGPKMRSRID